MSASPHVPSLPRPAEAAPPAALSAPPSLESLWHALRRRWQTAVGLAALAGLLGAAVAWCVTPAPYTAQTLLHIAPRAAHNGAEGEDGLATYQRTQTALVKSHSVIQGTLERPSVAELAEVRGQSDAPEWLAKSLVTDTTVGPEIIRVSLSGDRAEDLAVLLNELVVVFGRESAAKEEGRIRERIKLLKDNYRQCAEELRQRRQTLLAREEEAGVDDPETLRLRLTALMQQLASLQSNRVQLHMKRKDAESEMEGLRDLVNTPERIAVSEFAVAEDLKLDPVMKKHFDRLTEVEGKIQTYRRLMPANGSSADLKSYERERDTMQRVMAEYQASVQGAVVARLRSKQVAEAKETILKLERSLASIKGQERQLDGEIRRVEGLVSSLRGAGRPLDKGTTGVEALRDEVTRMEVVLKKVGEEMGNLQAELPAASRVTQLEPAKPPTARKRDKQVKAAGAAGLALFGLVFVGIGLLEFRHRRVNSSQDVSGGLGLALLGTLPEAVEESRRVAPQGQTLLSEAADGVRARLLHAARQGGRRVLLVTSAVAGEGKTSLASQLAASLARGGHRALLIDADLRNPAAHRPFGLPVQPGLAEALRDEAPPEQLVRPTPVEGLALLPAGRCDRRAVQALARDGLPRLLERLKRDYEYIVLDACPVLPVADALLVGQHADAAVLAVLRNVSRLPAVYEAQRRLAALDIPTLGAVVLGEAANAYGVEPYLAGMKS